MRGSRLLALLVLLVPGLASADPPPAAGIPTSRVGGGDAAMYDFCAAGGRGIGYDAATDTYGATCANYSWSAISGGISGSPPAANATTYQTPTTAGGSGDWVTCTGPGAGTGASGTAYSLAEVQLGAPTDASLGASTFTTSTWNDTGGGISPDRFVGHVLRVTDGTCAGLERTVISNTVDAFTVTQGTSCAISAGDAYLLYNPTATVCRAAGEKVKLNAPADLVLAIDHLRGDGVAYLPEMPGASATIYQHRGCGWKGNAGSVTRNGCPVLRAPHDTHYQRTLQVWGPGRKLRIAGSRDFDSEDNGRRGVWLVDDTGIGRTVGSNAADLGWDQGGPAPGVGARLWPNNVGPGGGNDGSQVNRCAINSSGDCEPGNDLTKQRVSASLSAIAVASNLGADQTTRDSCTVNTDQFCSLDTRILCSVDGDCTPAGAGTCKSFAEVLAEQIAIPNKEKPLVAVTYENEFFPETGSTFVTEGNWGRASAASLAVCNTTGETWTWEAWPAYQSNLATGSGTTFSFVDPFSIDGAGGGIFGGNFSPNNWYGLDLDKDGVCEPGDCCSGGTVSQIDGVGDEAGCDTADGLSLMGGENYVIDGVTLHHCQAGPPASNSCLDGDTLSRTQIATNLVILNGKRGFLADLSDDRIENLLVDGGLYEAGLNTNFTSHGKISNATFRNFTVTGGTVMSSGIGRAARWENLDFDSTISQRVLQIRHTSGALLENIRFNSVTGTLLSIWPIDSVNGPITLRNWSNTGNWTAFSGCGACPTAAIEISRAYQDSVDFVCEPILIDNVQIHSSYPDTCLLWLDDDTQGAESNINLGRPQVTLQNSAITGINGATGQKVVCVAETTFGAYADCNDTAGVCNALDDTGILNERFVPVMTNNSANRVPIPDLPWKQQSEATVPDCSVGGPMEGVIVQIHDDITSRGNCADTAGNLTGGGAFRSLCKCNATSGGWDRL